MAFISSASNLIAGLSLRGNTPEVYLRDLQAGTTTLVSASYSGGAPNDASGVNSAGYVENPAISADGRYIAFTSWATNLTATPIPTQLNVFVRDMTANQTTQIDVTSTAANPVASPTTPSWRRMGAP